MGSQASAAAVMVALRKIVRYLRLADREAEAAVGLSAAQLFVLHALHERPARSLAEIAERTLTDQSSVSTVVAKLADAQLVARKVSPEDRRRSELRLTPAGERLLARAPRMPQMRIADVVGAMPAAHREQLVASLDRLVSAIGAHEVAPSMLFEDEPRRVPRRSRTRARP